MAREITLAGLRMTFEEWTGLDDESRVELLLAFIETTARRADDLDSPTPGSGSRVIPRADYYESYELSLE